MMRRKNPNRCYNTNYKGKTMTQVLKQDTIFKNVELAMALINDNDKRAVASCSLNWYVVGNRGIPAQTCEEFDERDCRNNEDLEYDEETEIVCLEPSSAPSAAPSTSAAPSAAPSDVPSTSSPNGQKGIKEGKDQSGSLSWSNYGFTG